MSNRAAGPTVMPVPREMECPECGEELDWLDNIVSKLTGHIAYRLYICRNEECVGENLIYNDRCGYPTGGDPSGCY